MRKNTTVSGCKEPPAKMKGKGKLHDLMRWQRDVLVHGGALKTFFERPNGLHYRPFSSASNNELRNGGREEPSVGGAGEPICQAPLWKVFPYGERERESDGEKR